MKNDEAESRQVEGQTNNRLSVNRPGSAKLCMEQTICKSKRRSGR